MNKELPKELIEEETEKIYKKRFAEPEEIAKVICFLASEDAEYINGTVLKVDGGMWLKEEFDEGTCSSHSKWKW